jgi:hypothetical protein
MLPVVCDSLRCLTVLDFPRSTLEIPMYDRYLGLLYEAKFSLGTKRAPILDVILLLYHSRSPRVVSDRISGLVKRKPFSM